MDTLSIIAEAKLQLGSDWKIERVTYDQRRDVVDLYSAYIGASYVCSVMGEAAERYDYRKKRVWRHLDIFRSTCFIHCRVPRVCSSAGIRSMQVPWAATTNRFTLHFEYGVLTILEATGNPYKTATLVRCGANIVRRILHRAVKRSLKRRSLANIQHVSIDEKALKRKHHYATVGSDANSIVVLDLMEGRTKKAAKTIVDRVLALDQKEPVQTITTDMWKAYIRRAKECSPKARLIHDRFHLIQHLHQAMDAIRRGERKDHEELKNTRYALWKNLENRAEKQDILFQAMQKAHLQACKDWKYREDFKALFNPQHIKQTRNRFAAWFDGVMATGIQEVIEVAPMFQRHHPCRNLATIPCPSRTNPWENPTNQNRGKRLSKIRKLPICGVVFLWRSQSLSTYIVIEPL